MTRINIRREFGMIKIFDADGSIIATFAQHPESALLCGQMISALVRFPSYEVYDMDRNEFIVGDLAQMAA